MLKESDKQYLQSVAEKYGSDTIYNALFEYSYGRSTFDNQMHSAGQMKKYAGAKGAALSVPSFLLCSIISPPLTFVLLIGAIANRIASRWNEQKGLFGVLNPLTWAEYIATGNYAKKDSDGNTFFNRAPRRSADGSTDRSNIDAGDASVFPVLTPEEAARNKAETESVAYRYWFITFDNGEVVKIIAYDEDGAKESAKALINHPNMLKRLGLQISAYEEYKNDMDQKYAVYKAIFNDGQIYYTAGKTESEAKGTAKETAKVFGNQFDQSYANAGINAQKYEVPNLVRIELQEKLEIPLPHSVVNISNYASVPGVKNDEDRKKFFWQYGTDLYQVEVVFSKGVGSGDFKMYYPAENFEMARDIFDTFFKDKTFWDTKYGKMLKDDQDSGHTWYKAKLLDGDTYLMHAENEMEAKEIAQQLFKTKIEICKRFIDKKYNNIIDSKAYNVARVLSVGSVSKVKEKEHTADTKHKIIDPENIKASVVYKEYNEVKNRVEKTRQVVDNTPLTPK